MATIDMATLEGSGLHSAADGNNKIYVLENVVDIADAVTLNGTAIVATDVIQALNIPVGSQVISGGIEVLEATTGTGTNLTIDVGITGGDVDAYVDGFDLDGAAVGALAANGVGTPTLVSAADTIDILVATLTGTVLTGKVRVWAVVADVTSRGSNVGLAALGS